MYYLCKDGIIALSGCDKTVPGALMPLARLNAVSELLYLHQLLTATLLLPLCIIHCRLVYVCMEVLFCLDAWMEEKLMFRAWWR